MSNGRCSGYMLSFYFKRRQDQLNVIQPKVTVLSILLSLQPAQGTRLLAGSGHLYRTGYEAIVRLYTGLTWHLFFKNNFMPRFIILAFLYSQRILALPWGKGRLRKP